MSHQELRFDDNHDHLSPTDGYFHQRAQDQHTTRLDMSTSQHNPWAGNEDTENGEAHVQSEQDCQRTPGKRADSSSAKLGGGKKARDAAFRQGSGAPVEPSPSMQDWEGGEHSPLLPTAPPAYSDVVDGPEAPHRIEDGQDRIGLIEWRCHPQIMRRRRRLTFLRFCCKMVFVLSLIAIAIGIVAGVIAHRWAKKVIPKELTGKTSLTFSIFYSMGQRFMIQPEPMSALLWLTPKLHHLTLTTYQTSITKRRFLMMVIVVQHPPMFSRWG